MKHKHTVQLIVGISLVTVVSLSCFSLFFLSPAFNNLVIENARTEAVKVGGHLSEMFQFQGEITEELPANFHEVTDKAVSDFGLLKIKLFAADGKTVYSSSEEDIGRINKNDYFHDIVATGQPYAKVVKKNTRSLEGQMVDLDVVETYVPIMKEGRFAGAFEIYLDITDNIKELDRLLLSSNTLLLILAFGLLMIIAFTAFIARSSFKKQELAEKKIILQSRDLAEKNSELNRIDKERIELIEELKEALSKIKTLYGILPICMYCKKIKNDKGAWDKVERYVSEHSGADFTHGICPDCLDIQLDKLNKEKE